MPPIGPLRCANRLISKSNGASTGWNTRPGAYLDEAQISRQLKMGRTPVHQALDCLMLAGLLLKISRKGVVVQSISLEGVLNILQARLVNERHCVVSLSKA